MADIFAILELFKKIWGVSAVLFIYFFWLVGHRIQCMYKRIGILHSEVFSTAGIDMP